VWIAKKYHDGSRKGRIRFGESDASLFFHLSNWRLLQAMQLIGESQKAGKIVAGFLDLVPSPFQKPWWKLQNELAVQHEKLTKQIILQNLKDAIYNKVPDENRWVSLTASFDMGWQKPGRSYNSLSGHAFLVDVLAEKY
jgi:hypothetical protein